MQSVTDTVAKDFRVTTPAAEAAARTFIEKAEAWGGNFRDAQAALRDFIRANVGEASGFVSKGPLSMAVYGVVFQTPPKAGFIPIPAAEAADLAESGLRGTAYFPDTNTAIGVQAHSLMRQLSRIAEQRPLLSKINGVQPLAVEGGKIVLSSAVTGPDGGIVVKAAPSALASTAELEPVSAKVIVAKADENAKAARTMKM